MKYSSSLLQKFITVLDSPEHIVKNLVLKSYPVTGVYERKIPETIVIGKVVSCEKHPDADKLSVCQVDCGEKGKYQILCGGANVKADIFVPVALIGTHFAKVNITIETRKMRGLDSDGMICSKEEIGIDEDSHKHFIRSLTEDFDDVGEDDLGMPMAQKFPRLEGFVIDGDDTLLAHGHRGLATALHEIYDAKQISFSTINKRNEQFQPHTIEQILAGSTQARKQILSETNGLNSYILIEVNNITLQPSSFFTRLQMIDLGFAPANNRSDFAQLFMQITGQLLHFFDADKVKGNVIVRNAKDKETFVDGSGKEHELLPTDIVVVDDEKVLALAGVGGGLDSCKTENTKNILVEIADWDTVTVGKTLTRLGLQTDVGSNKKNDDPLWSLYCLLLFLDEIKFYQKDLGSYEIGGLSYYTKDGVL